LVVDLVCSGGKIHMPRQRPADCSRRGKWIARFAEPELMWKVLALATTFAANLTIVGSVANMIVVESAREHIEVSFWDYARFGIPITILTTAAGVIVLLVLR